MKNDDFTKLKKKIFLRVLLIISAALLIGEFFRYALIDGILQDPFADGFVRFCMNTLQLDNNGALALYQELFRNNKSILLIVGLIVLFLAVFYYGLSRFTRYFQEVSGGLDKLVQGGDEDIRLSPEMDFMEAKLTDIRRQLRQREKEAKEAEQRKNDLVVYLAHDIKTPLTSVIGYLSLLDEAPDMPQEMREKYVGITLEKAGRLEQLIDEFFEITRFNLQSIVLNKAPINLSVMLMQLIDEFYPLLAPQGRTAELDAEEGLTVFGDADKLARVFNNILKNAIAYSAENSTIRICAKSTEDFACIRITNSGEPIPAEKLDSIFEKFYRLDSSRSSRTGGSGLGLAIAREIVDAHGGSVSAESDAENTVFTVMLPIWSREAKKG